MKHGWNGARQSGRGIKMPSAEQWSGKSKVITGGGGVSASTAAISLHELLRATKRTERMNKLWLWEINQLAACRTQDTRVLFHMHVCIIYIILCAIWKVNILNEFLFYFSCCCFLKFLLRCVGLLGSAYLLNRMNGSSVSPCSTFSARECLKHLSYRHTDIFYNKSIRNSTHN